MSPLIYGNALPYSSVSSFDAFVDTLFPTTAWRAGSDGLSPILLSDGYSLLPMDFLNALPVTMADAKKQATYVSSTWEFGSTWAIREDLEFPRLLVGSQHAIPGLPGESIRNYVFVEPAPDGSMFYDGEIYKTLRMNNMISKFVGEPGEVVVHPWGGMRQRASDGKTYVYLASGVQDPDFPGGYGAYAPDTERTVTLRADRSINVNFYYILADLPEYNYLMRISVPGGGFHIAVLKEDVSAIKLKMPDDSICTVDIVTLEDEMASDIRVALPTGIFALKKVVLSG